MKREAGFRLTIIQPKHILAIAGQNGGGMPTYSIAKAKDNLSKLVDEAVAGEEVAITRHGKVVAYVRPAVERPIRQPPHELVAQIVERAKSRPLGENAVDIIRRMRDGELD
jgi:prevent-host-death family protein